LIQAESLAILQEIINIGVGKGAQVLNTLLAHHVTLDVPVVSETTVAGLKESLGFAPDEALVSVTMGYHGAIEGEVQLILPAVAASQMVSLVVGDDHAPEELDFIRQATLTEVGNIVINAVVGTLSNLFPFHLTYTLPLYRAGTLAVLEDQIEASGKEVLLLAKTHFTILDLSLEGSLLVCFSMATYRTVESALEHYAYD